MHGLGNNPKLYYNMVDSIEGMTLNGVMKEIVKPFENKNFQEMKEQAHKLKGASGYIGAGKIHYVCYYIQENFYFKKYEKMLDYYPSLVEAAIEFKVYRRKILCKYRNKKYRPEPSHRECDHSE
tara:strand:- start:641 stop:1012 length:372 start_codon:yes stop_codon:yes gene_type:complete